MSRRLGLVGVITVAIMLLVNLVAFQQDDFLYYITSVTVNNNNDNSVETNSSRVTPLLLDTALWSSAPSFECGMKWKDFQRDVLPELGNIIRTTTTEVHQGCTNNHTRYHQDTFVWTVSGGEMYRRYIGDLLAHWQTDLSIHMLVVALDKETAETVCQLNNNLIKGGPAAIYWDVPAQSYSRVADAKFQVAQALATSVHQLFVELDVFCRQSPLSLMKRPNTDVVTIGHGDLQNKVNIGMYYLSPSPRVSDFLQIVVDALRPSVSDKTFKTSADSVREYFDQSTFHDCLDFHLRGNPKYFALNDTNLSHNMLEPCDEYSRNLTKHMVSNLYISSYMPPAVHDSTICIHPLANTPFSSFQVKLATAKFLGFDPVPLDRTTKNIDTPTLYLKTVSGDLVHSEIWSAGFFAKDLGQKQHIFQRDMSLMIAAAQYLNRTLVLPRFVRDKHTLAHPVYSLISTASIEQYVPSWRFMSHDESRAMEKSTTVVEMKVDNATVDDVLKQLEQECGASKVCAIHGLLESEKLGKQKVLKEITRNLKWCLPSENDAPLLFTLGGHFEHPCN